MQNAINTVMLLCAILASLAFGVLAAYVICRGAFAALRAHAQSIHATAAKATPRPVARLT